MKTLYISGQMRSGTTLISTFLGHNKGVKILVDQARILTASGQAFRGKNVDFSEPLNVADQIKLFRSFINVTLWIAKNIPEKGMGIALKRLTPFLGYLRQIRSWDDKPFVTDNDILYLPTFRTHLDFFDVVLEHSVPTINRPSTAYAGNKETRGEKFAAAMAAGGKKSIVVIRDPRAVVCSLVEKIQSDPNFGVKSGVDEAIELWLKGYAICKNNPRINTIRYEDFIQTHEETVNKLADYLDVPLVAGSGILINNSSFDDVQKGTLSESGISRWREYKDPLLIGEITERCRSEIEDLDYKI